MNGPNFIDSVILKVFSGGFYRQHAGLLLFCFAMLASYGLLINTLGTVRPEVIDYWQFFFALNIAENPILTMVFCLICLGYAAKGYAYVAGQMNLERHFFVRQATCGMEYGAQLMLWLKVFIKIMLPIAIFALYMLAIGIVFGNYLMPLFLLMYVFILMLICALLICRLANYPIDEHKNGGVARFFSRQKPIQLLYLFQVIYGEKVSLVASKLMSCLLLVCIPMMVPTDVADSRIYMLTGAIVAMSHVVLLYREREFNDSYGAFVLNFPIGVWGRFFGPMAGYGILLLPEILFIVGSFPLIGTLGALALIFTLLSLFRSLLLLPGIRTKSFLVIIFSVFLFTYFMILSALGWYVISFAAIVSILTFHRYFLNRLECY